ncbi:hypothetical protein RAVI111496_16455 [Rahnella victoriana]
MSIPAYLFLTDENNSPIIDGSLVSGRVGAYEAITWKHCDGNIIHKDEWNERATA